MILQSTSIRGLWKRETNPACISNPACTKSVRLRFCKVGHNTEEAEEEENEEEEEEEDEEEEGGGEEEEEED